MRKGGIFNLTLMIRTITTTPGTGMRKVFFGGIPDLGFF
jgi:hypothetical protein